MSESSTDDVAGQTGQIRVTGVAATTQQRLLERRWREHTCLRFSSA